MKIADLTNSQNEKLVYCHINENKFSILIICHVSNFHPKDNSKD